MAPINHRSTCHTHSEYSRLPCHHAGAHETTIAPSVNAHLIFINVPLIHKKFHSQYLILHFNFSKIPECGLFKYLPPVWCSPVFKSKNDESTLCHIMLPDIRTIGPVIRDQVDSRT